MQFYLGYIDFQGMPAACAVPVIQKILHFFQISKQDARKKQIIKKSRTPGQCRLRNVPYTKKQALPLQSLLPLAIIAYLL